MYKLISESYKSEAPLYLFSPDSAKYTAKLFSSISNIEFDFIIASMIKASDSLLYKDDKLWTLGDIEKYGDNVCELIFPELPYIGESALLKAVNLFKLPKGIQNTLDLHNKLISTNLQKIISTGSQLQKINPAIKHINHINKIFAIDRVTTGFSDLKITGPLAPRMAGLKINNTLGIRISNLKTTNTLGIGPKIKDIQ